MSRLLRSAALMTLAVLFALPSTSNADRRKYVWTYQYAMMAPDAAELEFYQTTRLDDSNAWEYRIEIEHGLSHHWDVSLYQIFAQTEGGAFKWDAVQVRTRYRIADPGKFFLDPMLYLEYRRKIETSKQNKLEGKLLLARDFDRVNVAINPVYEFFWAPGEPVHELGMDIGLSYELSYKFSFGIESTSRYEMIKDAENETFSYFGPTISYSSGPIWYTFGYAFGLTDESDDARARLLVGVHL